MKRWMLSMIALAASGSALFAQNFVGSWQGTLQPPFPNAKPLRIVMKITRADDESWKAVMYSIDQGGQPINASSMKQQGSQVKIGVTALGGDYEGRLSADGNTIDGTWTQGAPMALKLERSTPATAWAIPEPPPPPKVMAADAKPTFEVATIKPSKPDARGNSILVGRGGTNLFTTTNTSLAELIVFAYGLHPRQVTGGPAWMESDKFDLSAKPDREGIPNVEQLKTMLQMLLAERFQLMFHRDKKELSVYAIGLAKTGPKLAKTQGKGNLPGFGGRGPGNIMVFNSSIEEFAGFLQSRIVDRPVVDQTGLTDRYDFQLKWTPDSLQAAAAANAPPGAPPPAPPADNADAPPDLFAAIQQQLGLKLEATKAPVEVLVIDRVEKPSEN